MTETTQPSNGTTTANAWHRLALVAILLLVVGLHFFRLDQEGYANQYYAAAVKSQLTGWSAFFFNSFDAGGFVTVDKPPLGLWVQTASAALLGFEGISLLLPQAVAGVLSVLLLYHLVRRTFGPAAGLLAALVLTVTPISVATNRNNTMDSQLILILLLAAWTILRAVETGRKRWLLLCVVLVGLGFNVKMLQAFLVLPAFYLLYLLAAPVRWWERPLHLALATVVLAVVSFAWVVAVDLTPADRRPYVGSSTNNTVTELIVGHNGLSRLLPGGRRWIARLGIGSDTAGDGGPGGSGGETGRPGQPAPGGQPGGGGQAGSPPPGQSAPPPGQGPPGRGASQGGRLADETGEPGLGRLFNRQLAGQISWLLPLAGLGLGSAACQDRMRFPLGRRHQNLLLWAAWLAPMIVFFSVANLFHRYYLGMLAPAIAALVGAGVGALWQDYRRPGWRGWLLPLGLVGSAFFEARILAEFPEWSRWLTPLVVGASLVVAGVLAGARLIRTTRRRRWTRAMATAGVLVQLVPLLVWAWIPVWYGGHAGLPYAGPELIEAGGLRRDGSPDVGPLAGFLLANQGETTYLVATLSAQTAAPLILETGQPVMAMGGFSGGDPILAVDELDGLVADGTVRFFLLSSRARPGRQGDLTRWVAHTCLAVDGQVWGGPGGRDGPVVLWDCEG